MKQLDISSVKKWIATGSSKLSQPASVGITCPECSMRGVFTTKRRQYDEYRDTLSFSAECPACNLLVHFWITDMVEQSSKNQDTSPSLFMMPSSEERMDLESLPDCVPKDVMKYCSSTQDVYFSGNLTATTVLAQSAIESIFAQFLPLGNSRTTLAKLITDSTDSMGLDSPFNELAKSLRPDGNLAELFSSTEHTTQETADAIMRLLELLITHVYIMPEEFKKLDTLFAELNRTTNLARKGLSSGFVDEDKAA